MMATDDPGINMHGDVALQDARQWVELMKYGDGIHCPCCGQFAKIYRRTINSSMARSLIALHQQQEEWIHAPSFLGKRRTDQGDPGVSKLAYWDLVEEQRTVRADGGRAGWWRVTRLGHAFAMNRLQVPKYSLIYNGEFLEHDGDLISIAEALGTKFSYADLMSTPASSIHLPVGGHKTIQETP